MFFWTMRKNPWNQDIRSQNKSKRYMIKCQRTPILTMNINQNHKRQNIIIVKNLSFELISFSWFEKKKRFDWSLWLFWVLYNSIFVRNQFPLWDHISKKCAINNTLIKIQIGVYIRALEKWLQLKGSFYKSCGFFDPPPNSW